MNTTSDFLFARGRAARLDKSFSSNGREFGDRCGDNASV
jgi:hypothetical protein